MKTYLAIAGGLPLLLVCAVATTNYVLDPYLIHQWQTPQVQRLRQPVEKLNAWGKTYAMAIYRPETIYLGNSRTELGLAVPHDGRGRIFNAALSGATVGDVLRMLGHARQVGEVRTVIWGLDAPSFTLAVGNTELEGALLATDERYLERRVLQDLRRAVSVDMTRESFDMLRGERLAVCHPSLAHFGQRDAACMHHRIQGWGGTAQVNEARTREFLRGEGPAAGTLESVESAIKRACKVHWRLYVNPTHAMTIDGLYWAGKGLVYEAWLASLAAMGGAGCEARVAMCACLTFPDSTALPARPCRSRATARICGIIGKHHTTAKKWATPSSGAWTAGNARQTALEMNSCPKLSEPTLPCSASVARGISPAMRTRPELLAA